MAALATTTLGAAIGPDDSPILLASTSGIFPNTRLYVTGELLTVLRVLSTTLVVVQRGQSGSAAASHASGATVYVGTASQFYISNPVGLPGGAPLVTPWINVVDGIIWVSSGGTWVPSSSTISAGDIACASLTATGAVAGATVAASGAITGASAALTGAATAASVTVTGNVRGATFSVGATAGIDGSVLVAGVGTMTFTKGILTAFVPA